MKQKTIKTFILSAIIFGLSACGGSDNTPTPKSASPAKPTTNNQNNPKANTPNPKTVKVDERWFNPDPSLNPIQTDKYKVKKPEPRLQHEINEGIKLINQLRREKGLNEVVYDETLSAYAQRRAEEISHHWGHNRPDGSSYLTESVEYMGENIGAGTATGQTVFNMWKNSQGHYDNMVNPHHQTIGLGFVYVPGSQYGYYWALMMGYPKAKTKYTFDGQPTKNSPLIHEKLKTKEWVTSNQQHPNWVFVDGKGIALSKSHSSGQWQNFKNDTYEGVINGNSDVRYGLVKKGNSEYLAFQHGEITPNMPSNGSAIYSGHAVISDGRNMNTNPTVHLKADFGKKQLNGAIVENNQKVLGIHAHIRGNGFYSPESASVATEGNFYGQNANSVGGVFLEEKSGKHGSFGAIKQ